MAKEELEDEIEYEEYDDYLEDKIEKDKSGQVKFQSVDHSKRAEAFGVESDGEISTYANYALEYFRHRCALSGERLVVFDTPVKRGENKKVTTNLSAEHIVALSSGGNDIIPNIVPSVLQYNLQKNGYYILDWWPKAKDINGNSIYSPEKLLKIVNYMLKSLQIRKDLGIKEKPREYRKRLLTPNVIDKYLAKEEVAQKLLSDVITATEEDIDGKKILTKIPVQEGSIPSLAEQKENELKITEEMFLIDAIDVLEREKDIPQEIIEDLKDLYKEVEGEIPFEIQVRKNILSALEEMGIEENKYTVANTLLININLLEQTRENKEEIKKIIKDYLEKQVEGLKEILTEDQIKMAISNMPNALYEETAINRIIFWKETRGQNLEEILQMRINATENLIDVLIILKQHGIDIRKIPNANKQLEEWLRENKIDNKEIEEIMEEITTKGIINLNIGNMQSHQKNKNNIENYKSLLEEAVDEKGEKVFSEEEIEILTISRQISNNQTKDLVDMLIILKQHGIDIRKIPNANKQLEEWLIEKIKLEENEIKEIIKEVESKGIINRNIGKLQNSQKGKDNIKKYKTQLETATYPNGERIFDNLTIKILTGEIDRKKVKDIIKQNKDNLFEAMDIGEELETEIELAERMDERNTNDGR